MLVLLSVGMVFALMLVVFILLRWGGKPICGEHPVSLPVFIAILFTSGLDVGLIMFPLTEFPVYSTPANRETYGFTNPLALVFGFWGFLVWCLYFLTCFYFCAIEPKIQLFRISWVKWLHNLVIIITCAFTAYLLFVNLNWYWADVPLDISRQGFYALIVAITIVLAVFSSSDIRFVRLLSVFSGILFFALILFLIVNALWYRQATVDDFVGSVPLLTDYFGHINKFVLPLNEFHGFYLFWWFAWSMMIGQFTAKFVNHLKVRELFLHLLLWPSLSIAVWFCVLYVYFQNQISTGGLVNGAMITVGLLFVLNSLDSLIRLYSENLKLTTNKLGKRGYLFCHTMLMFALCALFSLEFLKIQWIGALVISLMFVVVTNILVQNRSRLPDPALIWRR